MPDSAGIVGVPGSDVVCDSDAVMACILADLVGGLWPSHSVCSVIMFVGVVYKAVCVIGHQHVSPALCPSSTLKLRHRCNITSTGIPQLTQVCHLKVCKSL